LSHSSTSPAMSPAEKRCQFFSVIVELGSAQQRFPLIEFRQHSLVTVLVFGCGGRPRNFHPALQEATPHFVQMSAFNSSISHPSAARSKTSLPVFSSIHSVLISILSLLAWSHSSYHPRCKQNTNNKQKTKRVEGRLHLGCLRVAGVAKRDCRVWVAAGSALRFAISFG